MTLIEWLRSLGIAEPLGLGALSVVVTFCVAWFLTQQFIPRVRAFAIKVGWADLPNERRLNREPLPNAGGLAIFAGFICSVVVAWALRPIVIETVQIQVLAILLGASLLVLTGFIDDQFGLSPLFRIVVQVVAAALLMVNGMHIDLSQYPWLSSIPQEILTPLSVLVTLVWVVGITNAVNLMDGVDGVVGGLGFISSMVMLAVAAQFPDRAAAVVLLAGLAGASLGFLRYNFNPSRIIMGDAGAYLFGYTLAALSLLGTLKSSAGYSLLVPLFILGLPILDTLQVIVGRIRRGVSPTTPDKTHVHHRLYARLGARGAAVTVWSLVLLLNIGGMWLQGIPFEAIGAISLFIALALAWVVFRRFRALMKETNPQDG
ncbi:MAG: MraY family glycosyltransferase [Deinococcaceae bacterium]